MKRLIVYTDGASRGNPGPAGIGVVICNKKGEPIKEYSHYLGEATNNEAEYKAVIFSLKKIKALFGKKKAKELDIEIRADSELLIKQLQGKYKILDSKIQPLFLEIWNLKLDFKNVKFTFIPRKYNRKADKLANESLDLQLKTWKLF
ncbi:ribonuclease HI family protein [bacterium]|nr:ribonuclease HI family protein [bacterium]